MHVIERKDMPMLLRLQVEERRFGRYLSSCLHKKEGLISHKICWIQSNENVQSGVAINATVDKAAAAEFCLVLHPALLY